MPVLVDDLPLGFLLTTTQAKYRVAQRLGNGAFGAVYDCEVESKEGTRSQLPDKVAIKILKLGFEPAAARFRREREAMKILALNFIATEETAGVCDILDEGDLPLGPDGASSGGALPFFVLPMIDGAKFFPGDPGVAGRIGRCLALLRTMHKLHEVHGPHRDLKPSNVLVDSAGLVWILDFGLTVGAGPESNDMTRTGQLGGTEGWSAPEQRAPRNGNSVDGLRKPIVDVYAIGRMLCESILDASAHASDADVLASYYGGSLLGGPLSEHLRSALASAGVSEHGAQRLAAAIAGTVEPAPEHRSTNLGVLLSAMEEEALDLVFQLDEDERDLDAEDEADIQLGERIAADEESEEPKPGIGGLRSWQIEALAEWRRNGSRGIIEAVTGTGKSRVGVEAVRRHVADGGTALIVVPKKALLKQWVQKELARWAPELQVGAWYQHSKDRFAGECRVIVATIQSLDSLQVPTGTLLVADECHNYGTLYADGLKEGRREPGVWARTMGGKSFGPRMGLSATVEKANGAHKEAPVTRAEFGGQSC